MDDVIKKMLDEIYLDGKSKKCTLTTVDTSVVNMWNITDVPEKVIIRKTRIKRIFN